MPLSISNSCVSIHLDALVNQAWNEEYNTNVGVFLQVFVICSSLVVFRNSRYALNPHITPTATHTLFPADRSHIPGHTSRETTTIYRPFFSSDDLVFPNSLHAPTLRSIRGNILRFPERMSESLLHRRLRDDTLSTPGRGRCSCFGHKTRR
jgi:hypothetical protein